MEAHEDRMHSAADSTDALRQRKKSFRFVAGLNLFMIDRSIRQAGRCCPDGLRLSQLERQAGRCAALVVPG